MKRTKSAGKHVRTSHVTIGFGFTVLIEWQLKSSDFLIHTLSVVKRNKTKKNANLFRYLSELKVTIAVGRSRIFGIYIKLMSLSSFKRNFYSYNTGNEESKFLLPRQLIENVNHPSMTSSVYPFVKAIKVDNYTCVAGTKKKNK